jgi:hypothetical protein
MQLVQFSYPRASHAPRSFHLNLKMVSDQKYPRVPTIQTTCSCFYCFSRTNSFVCLFFNDNPGYLPAVLYLWSQARPLGGGVFTFSANIV